MVAWRAELRYEYIISPVPRDAGTCADGVAPPCPPPGPAVPLSLFLSSTPPPPLVARSSSGHRTLLSVPALIIHALTNPPPTRQGSTRREGSTTLVLTRRSLGGAWTIPQSSCFA